MDYVVLVSTLQFRWHQLSTGGLLAPMAATRPECPGCAELVRALSGAASLLPLTTALPGARSSLC